MEAFSRMLALYCFCSNLKVEIKVQMKSLDNIKKNYDIYLGGLSLMSTTFTVISTLDESLKREQKDINLES